jgi:hypothetical protein
VLIAWAPLALLALVQEIAFGDERARSFFVDFAAQARFLIAVPLLIIAEAVCLPRLERVGRLFVENGVVAPRDVERFDAAVLSTRRRLRSPVAKAVIWFLAYVQAIGLKSSLGQHLLAWWELGLRGDNPPSLAAWWAVFVSIPLLSVLILSWIWRQFLWGSFLRQVSQLDLQLVPPHPDGMGGIRFVESTLKGYWPISVAIGAVLAGIVANQVIHEGASPLLFLRSGVGTLVALLVLVVVSPLLTLRGALRRARQRGRASYGLLASNVGRQFEQTWLDAPAAIDRTTLEVPDFSATTDLFQVVEKASSMATLPFSVKSLGKVLLPALLPFIPVAFAILPLDQVLGYLKRIAGFFL